MPCVASTERSRYEPVVDRIQHLGPTVKLWLLKLTYPGNGSQIPKLHLVPITVEWVES
ncbi:hypothetical protein E2C01_097979 [Portunus trituberculatus]|uniref:Uncharacterized protein n=1 Tax=Portunus trituberculatus TaxID=210409 RepID=A0A5B7K5T5_PORTR|nr:hypothetical protein [Portunus trituberculatus]